MCKEEIYRWLNSQGIPFEVTEHRAVYSMEELSDIELPYPADEAKNLFVRDDKKRQYYLITVKGEKRVDLKAFRQQNGTRPLSFASEKDLMEILGLRPGAVTPLGLLQDTLHRAQLFMDEDFLLPPGRIGVHPNDNTATIWLKTTDLVQLLQRQGIEVYTVGL